MERKKSIQIKIQQMAQAAVCDEDVECPYCDEPMPSDAARCGVCKSDNPLIKEYGW